MHRTPTASFDFRRKQLQFLGPSSLIVLINRDHSRLGGARGRVIRIRWTQNDSARWPVVTIILPVLAVVLYESRVRNRTVGRKSQWKSPLISFC